MATLLALFNPKEDPDVFEAHYRSTDVPIVRTIPGVERREIGDLPGAKSDAAAPCCFLGLLTFVSMAELQAGIASPEGQAAAAELADVAGDRVSLLFFEEHEP